MNRAVIWTGVLLSVLAGGQASAQLDLQFYRTEDMNVVYMDEDNSYILPHLARCFENSLGFHKDLFDYQPSEEITVLLQDFDDYGYAGATPLPSNYLTIGIEPFEYVYETSPTNERINWVMSHELLHIVASDQAAPRDQSWRKFFGGKVVPDPRPAPVDALRLPDHPAPVRTAVVPRGHGGFLRDLDGWRLRPRPRRLRRDGVSNHGGERLLFLRHRRSGVRGQGHRLPGGTGVLPLRHPVRQLPGSPARPQDPGGVAQTRPGKHASYRAQFKRVYGTDLDSEWQRWIEWEHAVAAGEPGPDRHLPGDRVRGAVRASLGSVSRAYFDPDRNQLVTAVNYPGEFAHIATVNPDTWEVTKIAEIPTPALYYVTALAYDPESGTAFFTTDN